MTNTTIMKLNTMAKTLVSAIIAGVKNSGDGLCCRREEDDSSTLFEACRTTVRKNAKLLSPMYPEITNILKTPEYLNYLSAEMEAEIKRAAKNDQTIKNLIKEA